MVKPFRVVSLLFIPVLLLALVYLWPQPELTSPAIVENIRQRNLSKYEFDQLASRKFVGSPILLENIIQKFPSFTSYLFSFTDDEGNRNTGQFNIPMSPLPHKPIILLVRGYVDKEIYTTGTGTKNAAAFFAQNGYYTISPDFLGFGGSDPETDDILSNRFAKPATILSLLASFSSYPQIYNRIDDRTLKFDDSDIGIWAHSNGGQITMSVLEITRGSYPTTLWAPVSIGFPDSVTHFLEDSGTQANYIQNDLSDFQNRYLSDNYSISTFFDRIKAPIQIHQGGRDDAVPQSWSDNLVKTLLDLNLRVDYFIYPNSDHHMRPDWDTAIKRDLEFFRTNLASSKFLTNN